MSGLTRGKVGGSGSSTAVSTAKARARVLRKRSGCLRRRWSRTLRRFQDEVAEVRNGLSAASSPSGFSDYEEGDIIEAHELEKVA